MSEATRKAVDEAIAAHIADVNGSAYLTGYIVVAVGVAPSDEPGESRYSIWAAENQPLHVGLGLAQYLRIQQAEAGIGDDSE